MNYQFLTHFPILIIAETVVVPLVLCACLTSAQLSSRGFGDIQGDLYLRLYKTLDNKTNLVFSPNSIGGSLSILYEASSGTTQEAIEKVLFNYPVLQPLTDRHKYITSSLRNSGGLTKFQQPTKLYSSKDYALNDTLANKIAAKYSTELDRQTDFTKQEQTATAINDWIAHYTEHSFRNLVLPTDLDANTELFLVSVSDFYWQYYKLFDPSATVQEKFYVNDKDTVTATMMHMDDEVLNLRIDHELDAMILLFRFFNKNFELAILLPNKRGNIEDMKNKLFAQGATPITELLKQTEPHVVNVALPKLFTTTTIDLKDCLIKVRKQSFSFFEVHNTCFVFCFRWGLKRYSQVMLVFQVLVKMVKAFLMFS